MTILAVIGAGSMGAQIAQQAALHGVEVRLYDQSEHQVRSALNSNRGHIDRRIAKGQLSADDGAAALGRVSPVSNLGEAVADASLVIEAIFEDLEIKRRLFSELDGLVEPDTVLASNSSTIKISQIADATRTAGRCLNMHFFYPVLVMDLVEIVRGPQTTADAVDRAVGFARQIGRTPVVLEKEVDGFIVNRILHAATQEAYHLLDAGVASFEDIDIAVEKGLNWPLGPFRLGDFTGLDVTYKARLHMFKVSGEERFRPSPQLEAKVKAGELGRKTGRGWYRYEPN
jgi:3-hydroxybutyryl-CoA dehydrogenase